MKDKTPAQQADKIMKDGKRQRKTPQQIADDIAAAPPIVAAAASLIIGGMKVAGQEDGDMTTAEEQDQIIILAGDIQDTKGRLKTLREMQQDILDQEPKYAALQEAKQVVKGAEDALRIALSDNADYNNRQEDISSWKFKLADQEEILSQHLVAYRLKHNEDALEVDDSKERPIRMKASLGKERDIQTRFDFGGVEAAE